MTIDDAQFVNDARVSSPFIWTKITPGASADRPRSADRVYRSRARSARSHRGHEAARLVHLRLTDDRAGRPPRHRGARRAQGRLHPADDVRARFLAGSDARRERAHAIAAPLNALGEQMGSLNNLRKTLLLVTEGFHAPARRRARSHGDGRFGDSLCESGQRLFILSIRGGACRRRSVKRGAPLAGRRDRRKNRNDHTSGR